MVIRKYLDEYFELLKIHAHPLPEILQLKAFNIYAVIRAVVVLIQTIKHGFSKT